MRSKKRHDLRREGQRGAEHRKGFGVKGKAKVEEVKRRSGVAWDLVHIVEDVDGVGEYNWAEAMWEFLVHMMEERQVKMWSMKKLQINGFAMIRQRIPVIEVRGDERRVEVVEALIALEDYSAYVEDAQGVISVKEQLQRARDALRKEREALTKEKEAHTVTEKEQAELKEAVAMKTAVDGILEFARI
ncbi:hypothetical protein Cgig2_008546 [Carnegiea gigantea]|uniref:Uncharacterized protein n=1 Tax=Carnegiea gigantea TaxID=171969 RepID=A0A9Q1JXI1_9CARY|nr:hypothetical protein Cgig2_008546 [Carnegiea gigantea]